MPSLAVSTPWARARTAREWPPSSFWMSCMWDAGTPQRHSFPTIRPLGVRMESEWQGSMRPACFNVPGRVDFDVLPSVDGPPTEGGRMGGGQH
ncbi:unnamed protein product [Victoria cruziana]